MNDTKMHSRYLILLALLLLTLPLAACNRGTQETGTETAELSGETESTQDIKEASLEDEAGATSADTNEDQEETLLLTYSILGDSISTFDGYIPWDYNIYYPGSGEILTVEQTWWYQMQEETGLYLLSNASSSNTTVSGDPADESGSAPGCSTRRLLDLAGEDGASPDIILVYMGTNDFLRSVDLGSFSAPGARSETVTESFCEAYELMLQKLDALYPEASIYYCTILETNQADTDSEPDAYPATNSNGYTVEDFNAAIRAIASAYGYPVIDVHECGITYDTLGEDTSDGVHPNPSGAAKIGSYVAAALLEDLKSP